MAKSSDVAVSGMLPWSPVPPNTITSSEATTIDHLRTAEGGASTNTISDASKAAVGRDVDDKEVWSVWSSRGKKTVIFSASCASLLAPLASNIYFPALEPIARDLNVSNTLVNLSISAFIIFQGIAPTFSAQLSDTVGRRPVYLVCLTFFLAANIGLGAQNNYAALLTLRCFQSAGSSGIAALSGAIAADMVTSAERGSYVSFASALPMLATAIVSAPIQYFALRAVHNARRAASQPTTNTFLIGVQQGPVIGGVMAQYAGWHSIFWLLTAMSGTILIPMAIFFPETCRKVVGNGSIPPPKWNRCYTNAWNERLMRSRGEEIPFKKRDELSRLRKVRFPNPLATVMLLLQRECGFALFYSSILACSFYAVLALIPSQFSRVYHFDELQVALCYLPFGIGALLAALSRGRFIDGNFHRHAKRLSLNIEKNKKVDLTGFPIERARIEVAVPTIILTTACGIGFGWMVDEGTHVAGPLVMLFCIGFCASASLNCIATLLIDIYPGRAGAVAAANNLLRCALGAGATAATVPLIDAIGIGWTLTIFGLLNAIFMPLLWYIMREGPKWRVQRATDTQKGEGSK